jgi:hypothetical protein
VYLFNLKEFLLRVNPDGDDVFYGQALFPVPAEDPNDPLQVRQYHENKGYKLLRIP